MIGLLGRVLGPDYARPLRLHVTALVVYSVLQAVAFALLVPVLRALLSGDTSAAWQWLSILAVVVVATAAAYYVQAQLGYRVGMALSRAVHHRTGDHLAALPLGWFTGEKVGRVARLSSQGVVDIMGVPAHLLQPVVSAMVTPATVVAILAVFDWRLAAASLLTVPVLILVYRWAGNLIAASDHAVDAAGAEAAARVVEYAQTQAVLRAHGRARDGFAHLDAALSEQAHAGRAQLNRAVPGRAAFALTVQVAVTAVLTVGTALALGGNVDVAELIALLVLVIRFAEPLVVAADLGGALRVARNSLSRIDELLRTPTMPEPATALDGHPDNGSIALERVSFGYDSDRPVLHDVSLHVPPHTMTALVGVSGSGKTTITRLVARFHDVTSGTVKVGGSDVREQTTEQLMAQLSLVFQEVYLFDGTIADNIRTGRPEATDTDVEAAGRLARVDEIVDRLPDGYHTRVGEGGTRLSGGERQRIALARAILKDAPIVLLDEATSALDPANEVAIQDALTALTTHKTLLVIAHRLQTVRAADQIIVLDQGRIAEYGTHDQLMAAGGRYAAFWHDRQRTSGWRLSTTATPTSAAAGTAGT
ncbi:ABC transporter ATP-binding protein [Salinispora mooreana]|uniref:ABC transporter ATP-binding protein n=1 Tax=Salinispora mooreana TaxID=999545 RepID=UPI00036F3B6B|nr:ABC transporter ATP-binding protein [Salinispora mooreana]